MRICLDSNCLRDKSLIEVAVKDAEAGDGHLFLPDVLLAEMIKSSDWRSTMKSSLAHLREHRDRVLVADAVGPRMRIERDTGQACPDLYDEELTDRFRYFLENLDSSGTAALDKIKPRVESSQPDVESRLQSAITLHVNNLYAINKWKEFLTEDALKRLRRGDDELITAILSSEFVADVCRLTLASADYKEEIAASLAKTDSVSRRNFIAHEAALLRWLSRGGLDGRNKQQVANDYMDLEVAISGTYCTENRTKDTVVQELDAILRPVFTPTIDAS